MTQPPIRVLLVEDQDAHAELLRIRLRRFDPRFEVTRASNGREALELLRAEAFDLVILDYDLPGMNGIEILEEINASKRRLPVVVVTGQGNQHIAVKAMKEGASDYVVKEKGYELLVPRVARQAYDNHLLREKLRKTEERYRLLYENALEGIFVESAHTWTLIDVNPAAEKLTGLTREELLSRSFRDLVPADQGALVDRLREVVLERGKDSTSDLNLLRRDGELVAVDTSITAVEQEGEPVILYIVRDVTEKRRLEQQILLSKRRLQALFDSITDYIFSLTPDRTLIMVNRKLAEAAKARPEQLVGRKCLEVLHPLASFCTDCPAEETFATGRTQFREHTFGDRTYHLWTYPLFGLDGRVEMVIEHIKDVTEQRRLEKQLIKSEKLATIGLLSSGIAHELRNPLNIIETARYALEMILADSVPEAKPKLEIIRKNVQRASKIINNLLEFSRHSSHEREEIDLNRLLDSTLAIIEKELSSRRIEVVRDYGEIPPAYFNLDSLKQVFLNIMLNAVQAMPDGGTLTLRTRYDEPSGQLQIAFSDTGHGIPPEALPHIFTPFFTTKPVGEGTGLGMYISHTIVKREGGDIQVQSTVGRGTTFTVLLPAAGRSPVQVVVRHASEPSPFVPRPEINRLD